MSCIPSASVNISFLFLFLFVLALRLHLYEWVNHQGCWFSDFSHRVSVKQLCSSQLSESTECPYIQCHHVQPCKSSSQTHIDNPQSLLGLLSLLLYEKVCFKAVE